MMSKCQICGKNLKKPRSKAHITSQFHLDALMKQNTPLNQTIVEIEEISEFEIEEIIPDDLSQVKKIENFENLNPDNKENLEEEILEVEYEEIKFPKSINPDNENIDKKKQGKSNRNLRDMRQNLELYFKRFLKYPAYALFMFSDQNKQCRFLGLMNYDTSMRLKSMKQVFKLSNAFTFINGKPVYLLLDDVPYSLDMRLDKDKAILREKGLTLEEVQEKTHALYTYLCFGTPKVNINYALISILTIFASILITFLTTKMYFSNSVW